MPCSAPRLIALLLTTIALTAPLAGCTMRGDLSGAPKEIAVKDKLQPQKDVANDMVGNLRQAQLLRQAGSYDEAIHILSQLMLMAADDPRVVAEYGKALAQKGRASDATQFLRRAIELSPNDWTLYSALGVSYDQLGDAANARLAYEHALVLLPGEAGVLNNYALSRMLAKDPDGAKVLIARAQAAAGSAADPKIARNVELITGMAPDKEAETAKPVAVASVAKSVPAPVTKPAPAKTTEPKLAVAPPKPATPEPQPAAQNDAGAQTAGDVTHLLAKQIPMATPVADAAPRALTPPTPVVEMQPLAIEAQPIAQAPQAAPSSGVVMQAVPYDPYAGPVVKRKKPQPKTVAEADASKTGAKTDAPKADSKTVEKKAAPTKTAAAKPDMVPTLRVAADKY